MGAHTILVCATFIHIWSSCIKTGQRKPSFHYKDLEAHTDLFFRLFCQVSQLVVFLIHVRRQIPMHLDPALARPLELEEEVSRIVEAQRRTALDAPALAVLHQYLVRN